MFLTRLNCEQKELFYGLAKLAAEANGVVEESEKNLLAAYADEMSLQYIPDVELGYENILGKLKACCTQLELNQITFEIIAMIMSDSEYDAEEKRFMKKLFDAFDISDDKVKRMFSCLSEYSEIIRKINILMFDD